MRAEPPATTLRNQCGRRPGCPGHLEGVLPQSSNVGDTVHAWAHMRDASGRLEPLVLVWQKNPRPAVVHFNGACRSLYRSTVPDRSVKFRGPGTAGWLTVQEAHNLRDTRLCGHCM